VRRLQYLYLGYMVASQLGDRSQSITVYVKKHQVT